MKILIDADIFIALYNPADLLRAKTLTALQQLTTQSEIKLYTTWDVIDEVSTKLSYFMTKPVAVSFLDSLKEKNISILYLDTKTSEASEKLFSSISSKRVSMTDCANMTLYNEYQLDYLFSFDRVYQQQNIPLLTDFLKC